MAAPFQRAGSSVRRVHTAALLLDGDGRLEGLVTAAVDGLTPDELAWRPAPDANPVGWLVWHLTRVQDDHVATAFGRHQRWHTGWAERFDLPLDRADTGYGHHQDQVAAVRADSALLVAYFTDVHAVTRELLQSLDGDDLDRVVDTRWDPPVTLGVRLVSVLSDSLQHAGQAAYVRGLSGR